MSHGLLHTRLEHQHILIALNASTQGIGILGSFFHIATLQKQFTTQQSCSIKVSVQQQRFAQHNHGIGQVAMSAARSGIEEIHLYVVAIEHQSLLAHISHSRIVLHHIRHISHAQQNCYIIRTLFSHLLQLFVSLRQIVGGNKSLRQIVATLQISTIHINGLQQTLDGIVELAFAQSSHTVILQHVEITCHVLLYLFCRLTLAAE